MRLPDIDADLWEPFFEEEEEEAYWMSGETSPVVFKLNQLSD